MEKLRKIREHPNFERIKGSVEWKALKRDMYIILGMLAFLVVMAVIVHSLGGRVSARGAASLAMVYVVGLGMAVYYGYRVWELFWHIDRYTFTTVVLDQPHQGYKGSMYFTVEVLNRQGQKIKRDTRNIFTQWNPSFEEYNNRKVLVGYNEETDMVVVIQKMA